MAVRLPMRPTALPALRALAAAVASAVLCAVPGGCGDSGAGEGSPATVARKRQAGPDDLAKMDSLSKAVADSFETQALMQARMSRGETLNAADSRAYIDAVRACFDTCTAISAMLRENGTWQAPMRKSLERIAKPAIVRSAKAGEALDAASAQGKAGTMEGQVPRPSGEQAYARLEVIGMMPYTKEETDAIQMP